MSQKQPVFVFKEGTTQPIYFRPVSSEEGDLDLGLATDFLFTIKTSSLDSAALIQYQGSDSPSRVVSESDAEIKVTFAAADLALLTPGDYVAEIQIEFTTPWMMSETFIFRVVPALGTPS